MKEFKIIGFGNVVVQSHSSIQEFETRIDQGIKDAIEKTWVKKVNESKGALFNGTLLTCISVETSIDQIFVRGTFISYKYFWAQRNIPRDLGIAPIGVSGMLLVENETDRYFVFAKRTNSNLQYAGYYELVPSGGLNKPETDLIEINYIDQLMIELNEETGIPNRYIEKVQSMGLLLDTRDNVYDIACLIRTSTDKNKLGAMMNSSSEYKDFEFIEMGYLKRFIETNNSRIVPTSLGLIEMFNQLNVK